IKDALDFFLVVLNRANHADSRIESGGIGDLRRVEIIDAVAGRTVHQVVSRMLVGPGSVSTGSLDYLEDRVALDGVVRIDRDAVSMRETAGQASRIDHVQRDVR